MPCCVVVILSYEPLWQPPNMSHLLQPHPLVTCINISDMIWYAMLCHNIWILQYIMAALYITSFWQQSNALANEYDIHGTGSRILSSQFHCPSASASQWHQRVLRLGSGCPHRWGTPEQHHGWTHTAPGWDMVERLSCTYFCNEYIYLRHNYSILLQVDAVHLWCEVKTSDYSHPTLVGIKGISSCQSLWWLIKRSSVCNNVVMLHTCDYVSFLLGIGPSSCAASSSWWQWQGCPPHLPGQPAPELCQWQSVCQSSQHQHYRETAITKTMNHF